MISNDMEDPNNKKPEEDEEWEGEVPEYMKKRIDQIVEQIQKEPLPKPAKSKRRKTKGKKKFDRKVLSSDTMGLGEQLTEIKTNVIETRQALLNMYKIDKERFEFKKKIDKKLTTKLAVKRREAELEKPVEPGEENTSDKKFNKEEDSALDGLLGFLLGPLKKGGIAGLTATLAAFALPTILNGVESFLDWDNRDKKTDNPATQFFNWFIPKAENSNEPSVRSKDRTPDTGFNFVPSRGKDGKIQGVNPSLSSSNTERMVAGEKYDSNNPTETQKKVLQMREQMGNPPIKSAFDGGQFTEGIKKPLQPITNVPNVNPEVQKLTKPLSSAILVPQKVATLGVLNLANNVLKPFSEVLPKDVNKKVKDATSSDNNLSDTFKNFAGGLSNSILGIGGANAKNVIPDKSTPDNTQDQALVAAISALEGGNAQARVDVAQSIYNRANDPKKLYGSSISEVITADGQYQPAYTDPNASSGEGTKTDPIWKRVKDRKTAIDAMMSYYEKRDQPRSRADVAKLFDQTMAALANKKMQQHAAKHVGGRTEFLGANSKIHALDQAEVRSRGTQADNQFFTAYGTGGDMNESILRGPAKVPEGLFPMPKAGTTKTPDIKQNPKREMNMFEKFMNYLGGTPTQQPTVPNVNPPKITEPIGSDPMLQPGGY